MRFRGRTRKARGSMDKIIKVVFLTKFNCGICELMKPAWSRLVDEKGSDWEMVQYNSESEYGSVCMKDFPNLKLSPAFLVYRYDSPIGYLEGGHKYMKIRGVIEDIVNNK